MGEGQFTLVKLAQAAQPEFYIIACSSSCCSAAWQLTACSSALAHSARHIGRTTLFDPTEETRV